MQVKATAPRCSMRVTTVLHYPSLLPQTNVLLRPPLSRGLIRGPGQQKVLDSRQNVRDLALAIDQFDRMLAPWNEQGTCYTLSRFQSTARQPGLRSKAASGEKRMTFFASKQRGHP